jgi:adenylate kinase family enzyme
MTARRIVVAGITGSGKSTLARSIAAQRGLPFVELDGFVEGPGWTVLPDFPERIAQLAAGEAWVTDNLWYPEVEQLLLERADTVVWLDLDRAVILRRLAVRTLRRGLPPRPALVNGNKERLWAVLLRSSPFRTALHQHARYRRHLEDVLAGIDADVVRLRSPAEVSAWLSRFGYGEDTPT